MNSKTKNNLGQSPDKPADGKAQTALLSCARCHQRKIKCDKSEDGCSNCQKAGVQCHVVNRARLPRGRKGAGKKTDSDWKARLVKLEHLLKSYAQDTVPTTNIQRPTSVSEEHLIQFNGQDSASMPIAGDLSKYLGSTFWISLSKEITHIREILDDSSADEAEEFSQSPPPIHSSAASPFNFIMTGHSPSADHSHVVDGPDIPTASALCEIFLHRFSPLMKVGHGPSMRALVCGQQYLHYHSDHISPKLLRYAIFYAAVQTLSDAECQQRFAMDKTTLVYRYKHATEHYLARADLLKTSDLTVLESFVIYILALRAQDSSRQAWTLTAIAVRIGQAVALHLDDSHLKLRPFHIQMRRRLWHALRLSDIRTAYDRGTAPIIATEHCTVASPLNINDADLSLESEEEPEDREGYTDMTHSLICLAGSGLKNVPSSAVIERFQPGLKLDSDPLWNENQDKASLLTQYLEGKYLKHFDLRVDMQWYTHLVAVSILSMNVLFSARPLQRSNRTPGTDVSGDELLALAIDVLQKSIETTCDPRGCNWQWFTFVPWHALAVAIAELCVSNNKELNNLAWPIVEAAFVRYSQRIADSNKGMLWRPLEKLMKKARDNRLTLLMTTTTTTTCAGESQIPCNVNSSRQGNDDGFIFDNIDPVPDWQHQLTDPTFSLAPSLQNMELSSIPFPEQNSVPWTGSFYGEALVAPTESTAIGWDQWDAFMQDVGQDATETNTSIYGADPEMTFMTGFM